MANSTHNGWFSRFRSSGEATRSSARRLSWNEIRSLEDCRGRWVALRGCTFDSRSGQATEGELVDRDHDLAQLCSRLREASWTDCAVLFCPDAR